MNVGGTAAETSRRWLNLLNDVRDPDEVAVDRDASVRMNPGLEEVLADGVHGQAE